MAELTPVGPSPVVPNVRKVERDEKPKSNKDKERQQPKDNLPAADTGDTNDQPIQHIDEIV